MASRTASSRPSDTLGTASRRVMPPDASPTSGASRLEHEAPGVEHLRAADGEARVADEAVEVHGDAHRAADAGAGAEGDVDGAEDLLVLEDVAGQPRALVRADAELREVRPLLAGVVEQAQPRLAHLPARRDEMPVLDREPDGLLGQAERRERGRHDGALAAQRGDEALAAREVAEGAGRGQVALV